MITKQHKRKFSIAVGLIILVILPIAIYFANLHNNTAIEKRKIEITSDPVPIEGWGVIKKKILYPENLYRAGVDGVAEVMLQIDSVGEVKKVRIRANSSVFEDTIKYGLQFIKWSPARRKGKNVNDSIELSIHFDSRNMGERFIIIDGRH